jgi:hypothetical protein
MRIAKMTALGAVMMLCCGQQAPPAPTTSHSAREIYEAAVADYKKCVAVSPLKSARASGARWMQPRQPWRARGDAGR